MAFPTTAILDAFTYSNGNLDTVSGGVWVQAAGAGDLVVNSNQVTGTAATPTCLDYYASSNFGPDSEAYITVGTLPVATEGIALLARLDAATFNGYMGVYVHGSPGTFRVRRLDGGVGTTLGADISGTLAAGDGFGIEIIGSTIAIYQRVAGAWSQLGTRTDSTYNVSARVALLCDNNTVRMDDFGGGTYIPPVGGFMTTMRGYWGP